MNRSSRIVVSVLILAVAILSAVAVGSWAARHGAFVWFSLFAFIFTLTMAGKRGLRGWIANAPKAKDRRQ